MGSLRLRDVSGFSLVELMVVIAIMSIMLLIGVPSFTESFERQRINGLGDNLHFFMRLGKAEAAKRNTDVHVVFTVSSGTSWCVGLSDTNNACNCNTANACSIDGIERVIDSSDYKDVALNNITRNPVSISPVRGRGDNSNTTVNFSLNGKDIRLTRSIMGRDRVCSPSDTSGRYPAC